MQQIDAVVNDLRLPDTNGTEVRLGDLWPDGTTVVVWVRHYR